jgi:hypothetical protein
VVLDAADDMLEDPRRLLAGRPLARTQQRQHRLAGGRLEDMDLNNQDGALLNPDPTDPPNTSMWRDISPTKAGSPRFVPIPTTDNGRHEIIT